MTQRNPSTLDTVPWPSSGVERGLGRFRWIRLKDLGRLQVSARWHFYFASVPTARFFQSFVVRTKPFPGYKFFILKIIWSWNPKEYDIFLSIAFPLLNRPPSCMNYKLRKYRPRTPYKSDSGFVTVLQNSYQWNHGLSIYTFVKYLKSYFFDE